jgi:hypothetical protein
MERYHIVYFVLRDTGPGLIVGLGTRVWDMAEFHVHRYETKVDTIHYLVFTHTNIIYY